MSTITDLCEVNSDLKYMLEELTKEMKTRLKLEMKKIYERIDQIKQSRMRPAENLLHPIRRTRRSWNEYNKSYRDDCKTKVDQHSFVSDWRPSEATTSLYSRMDPWIEGGLQEDTSERIIPTIPTIQCLNQREIVIGVDSKADTNDEESGSKLLGSNMSYEDVHEASDVITLISKRDVMQTNDVEKEQQENIFHTRCHVKDTVCSGIIDGRSCTNVTSSAMVERLGMPVVKHPKPYRLQWLNETSVIKVMRQVPIPFRLEKYEDLVKFQEESKPKKKKKRKKKLKGKEIMQQSSFLAKIAGFVFDPGIDLTTRI